MANCTLRPLRTTLLSSLIFVNIIAAVTGMASAVFAEERNTNAQLLNTIQPLLKGLEIYTGTVDGVTGPKTRAAITEFERRAGLNVDGHLDQIDLAVLEAAEMNKRNFLPSVKGYWSGRLICDSGRDWNAMLTVIYSTEARKYIVKYGHAPEKYPSLQENILVSRTGFWIADTVNISGIDNFGYTFNFMGNLTDSIIELRGFRGADLCNLIIVPTSNSKILDELIAQKSGNANVSETIETSNSLSDEGASEKVPSHYDAGSDSSESLEKSGQTNAIDSHSAQDLISDLESFIKETGNIFGAELVVEYDLIRSFKETGVWNDETEVKLIRFRNFVLSHEPFIAFHEQKNLERSDQSLVEIRRLQDTLGHLISDGNKFVVDNPLLENSVEIYQLFEKAMSTKNSGSIEELEAAISFLTEVFNAYGVPFSQTGKVVSTSNEVVVETVDAVPTHLHLNENVTSVTTNISKEPMTLAERTRVEAENGDADAQFRLAGLFGAGEVGQAIHWYRAAAEQGHAQAQYSLAFRYENGLGVSADTAEALKWHLLAAEQGNIFSKTFVSDFAESEKIRSELQSAEQGDPEAQLRIAVRYVEGDGVPQDDLEALKWHMLAAAQGMSESEDYVDAYLVAEALQKDQLAAEQGEPNAQFNLATRYSEGNGLPKSNVEAIKWYRKAAENGHLQAQYTLGQWYELGRGTQENITEATIWYRAAAYNGHLEAQAKYAEITILPVSETEFFRECGSKQEFASNCLTHPVTWVGEIVEYSSESMRVKIEGAAGKGYFGVQLQKSPLSAFRIGSIVEFDGVLSEWGSFWSKDIAIIGNGEITRIVKNHVDEILASEYSDLCDSKEDFLANCKGHPVFWKGEVRSISATKMRIIVAGVSSVGLGLPFDAIMQTSDMNEGNLELSVVEFEGVLSEKFGFWSIPDAVIGDVRIRKIIESGVGALAERDAADKCRSDWKLCTSQTQLVEKNVDVAIAKSRCKSYVNDDAIYGKPKWSFLSAFDTYRSNEQSFRTGILTLIDGKVQFQNGFGAIVNARVTCRFDLRTMDVISVSLN